MTSRTESTALDKGFTSVPVAREKNDGVSIPTFLSAA
jgi:hypothetical protein